MDLCSTTYHASRPQKSLPPARSCRLPTIPWAPSTSPTPSAAPRRRRPLRLPPMRPPPRPCPPRLAPPRRARVLARWWPPLWLPPCWRCCCFEPAAANSVRLPARRACTHDRESYLSARFVTAVVVGPPAPLFHHSCSGAQHTTDAGPSELHTQPRASTAAHPCDLPPPPCSLPLLPYLSRAPRTVPTCPFISHALRQSFPAHTVRPSAHILSSTLCLGPSILSCTQSPQPRPCLFICPAPLHLHSVPSAHILSCTLSPLGAQPG